MRFDDRLLAERLHPYAEDFENWRLWLRWKRGLGHCGSIEWQYEPELLTEAEQRERENKGAVSVYSLPAMWLEGFIAALDPTPRMLLRLWWYGLEKKTKGGEWVAVRLSAQDCLHQLRRRRLQNFPVADFELEVLRWTVFVHKSLQLRKDQYILSRTSGFGVIPDTSAGAMPVAASAEGREQAT
jgi:hypothetical protein